jgi:hypothetical protein
MTAQAAARIPVVDYLVLDPEPHLVAAPHRASTWPARLAAAAGSMISHTALSRFCGLIGVVESRTTPSRASLIRCSRTWSGATTSSTSCGSGTSAA